MEKVYAIVFDDDAGNDLFNCQQLYAYVGFDSGFQAV